MFKFQDIVLGGGNSNMFLFSPRSLGEMIQFDLRIFFKGVGEKPPTSVSIHDEASLSTIAS